MLITEPAEDHHDIHLIDADGTKLASRRLPEGLAGIRGFHELVAGYAEEPAQVVIGIETDRGMSETMTPDSPQLPHLAQYPTDQGRLTPQHIKHPQRTPTRGATR
jgi:hypothetical protein